MQPYYSDALVSIYHGDAREVVPELKEVRYVFTSPPYNKGIRGDHRNGWIGAVNRSASAGRFRDGYGDISTDALPWDEYFDMVHSILGSSWSKIPVDGAMYVNHKPRVWMGKFWNPIDVLPKGVDLRQVMMWNRGGAVDISERGYASSHEWLMFCPRPDFRVSFSASARGDVWEIPFERENNGHPAPFPVALPKRALADLDPGIVLDPFAGTGSTLRAAVDLGMPAIGIELEERWCEVAANRMSQLAMSL